jgi:hypothetical protein
VLFIVGLGLLIDTGRQTTWHHVGNGATTAGFMLIVLPWISRRGDASIRKRRAIFIACAVVTVAAFLSVKLLR